jgi:hypothetical protein
MVLELSHRIDEFSPFDGGAATIGTFPDPPPCRTIWFAATECGPASTGQRYSEETMALTRTFDVLLVSAAFVFVSAIVFGAL